MLSFAYCPRLLLFLLRKLLTLKTEQLKSQAMKKQWEKLHEAENGRNERACVRTDEDIFRD